MGLLVIVFILFVYPLGTSLLNERNILATRRQVYATYTRHVQEYHDSPLISEPAQRILPYEMLTAVIDEVRTIASRYGLQQTHFNAAEPIRTDIYSGRFVETVVSFTLSGAPDSGAGFINGLAGSSAFVRSVRMDFMDAETAILRVEFSLFAIDE